MNVTYHFKFEDKRSETFKVTDRPAERVGNLPS